MLQILLFTLSGILLYFASDWLLNRIEEARGRRFRYRQAVYFVIILVLALLLFEFMQRLGPVAQ